MVRIIYNPRANNGLGLSGANDVEKYYPGENFEYFELIKIPDVYDFIETADTADKIILTGGDGTLNGFINALNGRKLTHEIYYAPAGSGNDFWKDIRNGEPGEPELLNPYIECLPKVTVNGKTSYFINGIGYGIDGYCCEKADEERAKSDKPTNYTAIAIKGLLYDFKPRKATITVDGVSEQFKNVWLVPVMNGRFYGGGMNVAPMQDRLNGEHTLSCLVMHTWCNIYALAVFPNIFKGKLSNFKKQVKAFTGKKITVEFDKPCALQIDGETVLNVSKYEAEAYHE